MKEYTVNEVAELTGYTSQYVRMVLKWSLRGKDKGVYVKNPFMLKPNKHFRMVEVVSRPLGVYMVNEKGLAIFREKATKKGKWHK